MASDRTSDMGFIDVHINGPEEVTPTLFRWDFNKGSADDDGPDSELAADEGGPDVEQDDYEASGRGGKTAALGVLVVLAFLAVTGLLVKRKLGGEDEPEDIDVA